MSAVNLDAVGRTMHVLLERTERPVYALVRAVNERSAAARTRRTLQALFGPEHPYAQRGHAVIPPVRPAP